MVFFHILTLAAPMSQQRRIAFMFNLQVQQCGSSTWKPLFSQSVMKTIKSSLDGWMDGWTMFAVNIYIYIYIHVRQCQHTQM